MVLQKELPLCLGLPDVYNVERADGLQVAFLRLTQVFFDFEYLMVVAFARLYFFELLFEFFLVEFNGSDSVLVLRADFGGTAL